MASTAYTPIPEWGWTFLVSVHRGLGLGSIPSAPGAFRLFWLVEGEAEVLRDGQRSLLRAPCLVCSGSRDTLVTVNDGAEVRAAVFHPGALNDAFLDGDVYNLEAFQGTTKSDQYYLHPFLAPGGTPSGVLPLPVVERLQQLFDTMEAEVQQRRDGFWPCRTRSLLLEGLMLARQGFAPEPVPDLAERIRLHLHTHYAEAHSLRILATRFATNRTTLASRFREKTGTTVGGYLRDLRMKVAAVLLRDSTLPVQEVLERVGFQDPSQFTRRFRQATGLSPSEYRAQHCWLTRPA
jgi:AraC family L-rhamnose operon regulatory protein RhaS